MCRKLIVAFIAVLCLPILLYAEEKPDVDLIQAKFAPAIVKVLYNLRYDDGDAPESVHRPNAYGESYHSSCFHAAEAIEEERPVERVGYLVAPDLVLTGDPMFEERFFASIEVVTSDGKVREAVQDSFALQNQGLFLRLAYPVENTPALDFEPDAEGPYFIVTPVLQDAVWLTGIKPLDTTPAFDPSGNALISFPAHGIIVTADARLVGFAASGVDSPDGAWKGSPLDWPAIDSAAFSVKLENIRMAASAGLLPVTVNFRAQTSRRADSYYDSEGDGPSELQTVGILYAPGKVLVLSPVSRRRAAQIESMSVALGDASAQLTLDGALKRYNALLTSFDGPLDGAGPLTLADTDVSSPVDALLVADRLDFDKFDREEHFLRARVVSSGTGFLGLVWPVSSDSAAAAFLFTLDGALAAVPLQVRENLSMGYGRGNYNYYGDYGYSAAATMPTPRLAALLDDPSANVNPDYRPLSEDDSKRLAWLGIEVQPIDMNLARAKNASLATKGGQIGAVVIQVYEGSPAADADVRPGDILLRFLPPDQLAPVDVRLQEKSGYEFPWAQLDQVADVYFERLPRPWPSRENDITKFLTEVGIDKTVTAVLLRDGQPRNVDFRTAFGPPDFSSAPKFEHELSGLTVKNITYEVRGYFRMKDDDPGVVVAEIQPGSKASVAGLKPCEIITAVNTRPIANVAALEAAFAPAGELSLTVQRMSQSRVVQIYLAPPKEAPAQDAAPPDDAPPETDDEAPPREEASE